MVLDNPINCVMFVFPVSGDDDCCSVVFGTLVGVDVFSEMCSEFVMMSDIKTPL